MKNTTIALKLKDAGKLVFSKLRRHTVTFALLLVLSSLSTQIFAQCCLTSSLVINTGYDPVANAAVAIWAPDPKWNVTSMDPGLYSDIIASGYTPVTVPGPADAESPASGWASYPSGTPGNWINSFNGFGYLQSTCSANYTWTVSRTFNLECCADVTFNITNISADNWITGGFVDGTPIPTLTFSPLTGGGICCGSTAYVFGGNPAVLYNIPSFTMHLCAGPHTISFNLLNDAVCAPTVNNVGFLLQGSITTPTPSIHPESSTSCSSFVSCPVPGPTICAGMNVPLPLPEPGCTWTSSNTAVAIVDAFSGLVTGVSAGAVTITCTPPGGGCPGLTTITVNPGCNLTSQLIINTGYDPVTSTAVTPGISGGVPQADPRWTVTSIDPGLSSAATSSGYIPVTVPGAADVINPAAGWLAYPGGPGGPGNWINSFNGCTYTQRSCANYTWRVRRTFNLSCDAQVTFNIPTITADNWIIGGFVDGSPIPTLTLTPFSGLGICRGSFNIFGGNPGVAYSIPSFTIHLPAGAHTIEFQLMNDGQTGANNIGFMLQGNITTVTPSIMPDVPCSCPATSPLTTGPNLCVGSSTTLTPPVAGGTWSSSDPAIGTVDGSGNVTGISAGSVIITYLPPPVYGSCPVLTIINVIDMPNVACAQTPVTGYPYFNYTITVGSAPDPVSVCYDIQITDPTTGTSTILSFVSPLFTGTYTVPMPAAGTYGGYTYSFPPSYITGMRVNCVNEDGCSWPVACHSGLRSESLHVPGTLANGQLSIVPNPNRGTFDIKSTLYSMDAKEAHIEVVDMLGRTVYNSPASVTNGNINKNIELGSDVVNGVYLLKVKTSDDNQVIRFTVDR